MLTTAETVLVFSLKHQLNELHIGEFHDEAYTSYLSKKINMNLKYFM